LIAAVIGGTVYGGIKIQGLQDLIDKQNVIIVNDTARFENNASKKLSEINAVSAQALSNFQAKLDGEAQKHVTEVIDAAKAKYNLVVDGEIDQLPSYFAAEKAIFLSQQERSGGEALTEKQTELSKSIDMLKNQLDNQRINLGIAVDNFNKSVNDALITSRIPDNIRNISDTIAQMTATVGKLQDAIGTLQASAGDIHNLSAALQAESTGPLTISAFIKILSWKDYLSVSALALSLLTLIGLLVRRLFR
jgi:hypothetical protein